MTRLRIASLFVAVVAGVYADLMLIDGQPIDFGVAAAICAGFSVAAALIPCAGRRRRRAEARAESQVTRPDSLAGSVRALGHDDPGKEVLT